jgi:hypothetical protein
MTSNLQIEFEKLAIVRGPLHPNYYNGSKGRSTIGPDYADRLVSKLKGLGMVRGVHFETGNDAKFHGHTGEWVELTPVGRRRKVFQDIRAAAKMRRATRPAKIWLPFWDQAGAQACISATPPRIGQLPAVPAVPAFDFDGLCEREIMQVWHDAGAAHPAPDEVLQIKLRSGVSWKVIADQLEDAA